MSNVLLPYRVHYLNLQPSEALSDAIEQGLALLQPHHGRISHCDVHVGRWFQHHDLGSSYRVTLELEPGEGALPVSVEAESERNAEFPALLRLLREAFQRASTRLTARVQHAATQPGTCLSPDARRLHPLHGLAPEEQQFGAEDG